MADLRSFAIRGLDCHEVHERLWVGAAPDHGKLVANRGFTHLVLCAMGYQAGADSFPGTVVLHCPFEDDDSIMAGAVMTQVFLAARAVAEAHRAGGNVLVTCRAGINRSALVTALALQMLGFEPAASVVRIRARRHAHCLANECFLRIALRQNRAADHFWPEVQRG